MSDPFPATPTLAESSASYLGWLDRWFTTLPTISLAAPRAAVLVVDAIEGFCDHGALASPRVARMVGPVANLLDAYQASGGAHVLLTEDAHLPDAREFLSFPPHCVAGTAEARTVAALAALERPEWRRFPKQTINGLHEPPLHATVEELFRGQIGHLVVVGDCTDLCIYQAAMTAQLMLNREEFRDSAAVRVVVPAGAVETYDLGVEEADRIGAQPHPGELLHAVFLHHMALNGITVVRSVRWPA